MTKFTVALLITMLLGMGGFSFFHRLRPTPPPPAPAPTPVPVPPAPVPDPDPVPPPPAQRLELYVFSATWCGACKQYHPELEKAKPDLQRMGYTITEIDVDQNRDKAQEYKIQSIPTTVKLINGQEEKRFVGVKKAREIIEWAK